MAPGDKQLTHDEIWDDTALVDSWNDALREYKKYHSIHANGGKLDDILELQQNAKKETEKGVHHPFATRHPHEDDRSLSNMDIESTDEQQRPAQEPLNEQDEKVRGPDEADATNQARTANVTAAPHGPQHSAAVPSLGPMAMLGSSVQDEGLKKLLMSWYYAGYYTGLYQGQQERKHS